MLSFLWNVCFVAATIWGPDVVPHQTVTPRADIGDLPPVPLSVRQGAPNAQAPRQMTLEEIVQMTQVAQSDTVIIDRIKTTGSVFALTADDVNYLHQQRVSDAVINQMQSRRYVQNQPAAMFQPYPPGMGFVQSKVEQEPKPIPPAANRVEQIQLTVTMAKVNPKALPILRCQWPQIQADQVTIGEFSNTDKLMEMLRCLKTADLAKILAEPRVVTLSGRPAYITTGGTKPIIGGAHGTPQVNYKQFGMIVKMLPVLQSNGKVTLDVAVELPSTGEANKESTRTLNASRELSEGAALMFSIFDEKEPTIILITPHVETPTKVSVEEDAVARVKTDTCEAKARCEAIGYLGSVDCNQWPEAVDALVSALRKDPEECVRLRAAAALRMGCCRQKKAMDALRACAEGSDKDGAPPEKSERVRFAAADVLFIIDFRRKMETIERIGVDFNQNPPVKIETRITPLVAVDKGQGGSEESKRSCKVLGVTAVQPTASGPTPTISPSVPPPPPPPFFIPSDAKPAVTGLDQMFSKAFEQMFNQGTITSDGKGGRDNNQLSVADVIALSKNGLSDAVIIRQLKRSNSIYELSANDLIRLSENAVSEEVIRAMQKRRK